MELLQQQLSSHSLVKAWEIIDDRRLQIDFQGGTSDCAELLRSLILADIPLTEFHPSPEDLEAIFLKPRK
jgi:ABC-2 type transport system ATP-binding protein